MDFTTVRKNLECHGFTVTTHPNCESAVSHLESAVKNETIGFGGSVTLQDMKLYDRLAKNNKMIWHWVNPSDRNRYAEFTTYFTSVNALAETGELVNIDGSGNRVAGSLFGPQKVFFVVGRNKITPDLASAMDRARNIASPLNSKRLKLPNPCVVDGRCHDCSSPKRICGVMSIHMRPMNGMTHTEVVLIDEDLGF